MRDSAAAFERVREACEAAGRYPASMTYSVAQTVCCGKDEAEFRRRAAAIGLEPDDHPGDRRRPARRARSRPRSPSSPRSAPNGVYLQVLDLGDLDHLALIASDVAPQV